MKIKMIKSPDRWVLCPICGNKTRTKIRPDTILENFPLFCPKCKQETLISAKDLNVAVIPQQIAESAGAVNGQDERRINAPPLTALERTSVEKGGDEVWVGEKFQSNPEIAGSPRNSFRASPATVRRR